MAARTYYHRIYDELYPHQIYNHSTVMNEPSTREMLIIMYKERVLLYEIELESHNRQVSVAQKLGVPLKNNPPMQPDFVSFQRSFKQAMVMGMRRKFPRQWTPQGNARDGKPGWPGVWIQCLGFMGNPKAEDFVYDPSKTVPWDSGIDLLRQMAKNNEVAPTAARMAAGGHGGTLSEINPKLRFIPIPTVDDTLDETQGLTEDGEPPTKGIDEPTTQEATQSPRTTEKPIRKAAAALPWLLTTAAVTMLALSTLKPSGQTQGRYQAAAAKVQTETIGPVKWIRETQADAMVWEASFPLNGTPGHYEILTMGPSP